MIRIVLADDHAFLRSGVEGMLHSLGMDVVASVGDGTAVLEAIKRTKPDLAVLDVRMPGLGGVEVLQRLRSAGNDIPVILLCAEIEDSRLLEAMHAGVNGIVFKQGAELHLEEAIGQVLAGSRYISGEILDRTLTIASGARAASPIEGLSERERRIVEFVGEGRRNKEIAAALGTTEGTIKIYLHRIFDKCGVKNRTELAILRLSSA